jgi:C-terminal processing protease CtpA/Prc
VEADPGATNSPSAQLAAAYAARKPGDVFSYEIPVAQPRTDERFTGQCFLLVNRYSYSNAVNVAALMQDYGFAKVLGEETSDLATSYGAMEQFTLSRTGIDIGYPKAFIIRPSGNVAARGVVPDLSIRTPLVESGKDEVLEHALALVK